MSRKIVLQGINLSKTYRNGFGRKKNVVMMNQSIELYRGEILGIMGNSGSGKSTLAKILLCLTRPDHGKIFIDGVSVEEKRGKELVFFRKKVQFIAQRPETFFDPRMKFKKSMQESVNSLIKIDNFDGERQKLMNQLDLKEELLDRYPHQISGGEIQRLAICRALLVNPEIIIFDEATSMLDVSTQAKIINLLLRIQKQRDLSYIFISHDEVLIKKICHRVLYLESR